jgi:hypothetical protein
MGSAGHVAYNISVVNMGVDGAGVRVIRPPLAAESKGRQNAFFKWKKKLIFSTLQILKLSSRIFGNPINNCDCFKVGNIC